MLCSRKSLSNVFCNKSFSRARGLSSALKPYYITTPIFYPNASPHIGHLYSLVTADVFARFHRLSEPHIPVQFVTGTDEHGLKIQQAANAAGLEPSIFCDKLSEHFRDLIEQANISNTRFIRTSEAVHHEAAQELWRRLHAKGLVYKGKHSGWYSVSDECFYTESQITEVTPVNYPQKSFYVSTETNSRVEWTQEENYMFRLSVFHKPLIEHLEKNPNFIYPLSRHQEVVEYLELAPLEDLSISRPSSRLSWGIPVPNDPEHTMYVWFEAVIAYLTAVGYPRLESRNQNPVTWPADLQIIGKDIIRFHAIYFPAILMALDMPLSKRLLTHSHWTVDRKKMSKSVGNVVSPFEAMELYGPDVVRFYLMRVGGRFKHDIDWSQTQLKKHAVEVMSTIGNFFSRCTSMSMMPDTKQSRVLSIQAVHDSFIAGNDVAASIVLEELSTLCERVQTYLRDLEAANALEAILQVLATLNRIYTELEPWRSQGPHSTREQLCTISLEALRICGILLQPFIPTKAGELLDALGVSSAQRTWEFAQIAKGSIGPVDRTVKLFVDPNRVNKARKSNKEQFVL